MKSCGHFFSWSNKGTEGTRISSRIDRGLVNSYWINKFPHVVLDYMNPGLSDHPPLLFQCHHRVHTKGKPFKFFNYMAEHDEFLQVVRDQWQLHGREDDRLKKVWNNLKCVKRRLKELHKPKFSNLRLRIDNIREDLQRVQSQLQSSPHCNQLAQQEKECILKLQKFLNVEETTLRQKSRIQWLKLGDSNSQFFFNAMKVRYMQNNIEVLFNANGDKLTTTEAIKTEVIQFYSSLLGTAATSLPSVDILLLRSGPQVQARDAALLTLPVSIQKIETALWGIDDDKAPGIDEFNNHFFKKAWPVVKYDICAAVM